MLPSSSGRIRIRIFHSVKLGAENLQMLTLSHFFAALRYPVAKTIASKGCCLPFGKLDYIPMYVLNGC